MRGDFQHLIIYCWCEVEFHQNQISSDVPAVAAASDGRVESVTSSFGPPRRTCRRNRVWRKAGLRQRKRPSLLAPAVREIDEERSGNARRPSMWRQCCAICVKRAIYFSQSQRERPRRNFGREESDAVSSCGREASAWRLGAAAASAGPTSCPPTLVPLYAQKENSRCGWLITPSTTAAVHLATRAPAR